MKLNFFVNVYDDFDDKTRKAIEAHFGLDKLFSQEELDDFAKTLPEQYKSYIIEQFDNVKDVDLSETEVAPMKKEIMIEQRAVVKLADNSERRTRMTFFVTLDFNSLCDINSLREKLLSNQQTLAVMLNVLGELSMVEMDI